ncbi:MAG: hypothetical protein WBF32_12605 [Candidatus Aminicenantaceae bacterium]
MKRIAIVLIIMFAFLIIQGQVFAQEDEEEEEGKKYAVNLSLWYPVSINKTKHDTVNLNLTLIYSRVGYVYGLDLSLIGSAITHDLEGVQICGLAGVVGETGRGLQLSLISNVTGESFTGGQATGLVNIVGNDFTGIQFAGLMNITGERGSGIQASGLFNIVGENYSGIQLSGGFNISGSDFTGLQAVGLFNIVGENVEGVQAACLFNVTGGTLRGLQVAAFNIAANSAGAQVGIINVAGETKGIQLGLVNYTKEENTGIPIGPVNLARNGRIRGIAWGGSHVAVTGGAKFQIDRLFSLLTLGVGNLNDNISESLTYGFHYGMAFPVGRLTFNPDIGYRYRDNNPLFKHTKEEPNQHMLEARLILGIPLSENLSLMLGAGLTRIFDCGKHIDTGDTSPLFVAGLEFF